MPTGANSLSLIRIRQDLIRYACLYCVTDPLLCNYLTEYRLCLQFFVFKVYDSDPFSFDEFLGQAFIKVDTLMGGESGQKRRTIELMNENGGRRKQDRITGSLTVVVLSVN